jgi:hypothetical protein
MIELRAAEPTTNRAVSINLCAPLPLPKEAE